MVRNHHARFVSSSLEAYTMSVAMLTSVSRMQRPKKRTTGSSLVGLNSRHMKKVLSMTRP